MKLIVEKQYQEDITFEIKLELDGGTCEVSSITATCGGKYEFPSVSKEGYIPIGWYTESAFENQITEDDYVDYNIRKIYIKWQEMTNYSSFEVTTTSSYKTFGFYSIALKDSSKSLFIDWGDGEVEEFNSAVSQKYHSYSDSGTYVVKVSDNTTSIQVSSNSSTYYNNIRYTLKKVLTFSTNITSIPSYCFYYAQALTSFEADMSSILSLSSYAFYYCSSLSSFDFLKRLTNITLIPEYCFYYCTYFTDLSVITTNVTSFGSYAFYQCRIADLSRIRSTDTLNMYCFAYNTTLTSLSTLAPRSSLPSYCFSNCTGLTTVDFSQFTSLTSIPTYCFYQCSALTTFIPPQTTSAIAYNQYCFGYTKLSSLSFVKTNDTLNSYCFGYMNSLTSIETLSPRSTLPTYCFYYCSGLKNVDMTNWTSLTQLNSYTFGYDYYLTSFTAPSSLTGMSSYPLYYSGSNSGILSVDLSKCVNLTSIPNYAFYYARGLKHIEFPENVKSIGSYAFYYCYSYLKDICIPSTVTSIGSYAFNYCYNLTSISCLAETAPTVQSTTFGSYSSTYTGRVKYSSGTNKLYVNNPSNYKTSYWSSILLDSSKCGFSIECLDPYNLEYGKIAGLSSQYLSTGTEITPDISVYSSIGNLLQKDTDYSVAYANNIEVGTAQVSAIGIDPYTGVLSSTFKIIGENTYTELQYIEGNGGVADLGYTPTLNTSMEFGMAPIDYTGNVTVGHWGSDDDTQQDDADFRFCAYSQDSSFWDYGSERLWAYQTLNTDSMNTIRCYNGGIVINGEENYGSESYNEVSTGKIKIFGQTDSATGCNQRLYYLKIYESDELKMNIIPIKNSSGTVCFYDTISETEYPSVNGTNFVAGPEK